MHQQVAEKYREVRSQSHDSISAHIALKVATFMSKETGPRAMLKDLEWEEPSFDVRKATLTMGDYKVTFEMSLDPEMPQEDVAVYLDPKLITDWDNVLKMWVSPCTHGTSLAYVKFLNVTYEDLYEHFHRYQGLSKGVSDYRARKVLYEDAHRALQFGSDWWYTWISATVTHATLGIELGSDALGGVASDIDEDGLLDVLTQVFEQALDCADDRMKEIRKELCSR